MATYGTLTCPVCGYQKTEQMPTVACQWFYEREQCHAVLRPKAGGLLRVLLLRHGALPPPFRTEAVHWVVAVKNFCRHSESVQLDLLAWQFRFLSHISP